MGVFSDGKAAGDLWGGLIIGVSGLVGYDGAGAECGWG